MTVDEFREIVRSMSEEEYTGLKVRFGTDSTRMDFVRDFARHPEWDEDLSRILDVPTESYREEAVRRSATIHRIQAPSRVWLSQSTVLFSLAIVALSLVLVSVAVVLVQQFTMGNQSTMKPDRASLTMEAVKDRSAANRKTSGGM